MPFKSLKQKAYLYMNLPDVAKRFEHDTPKGKKLPVKVKKSNNK